MPLINGTVWTPFFDLLGVTRMQTWESPNGYNMDHFRRGPFQEDLRLTGYVKGRSSMLFEWTSRLPDIITGNPVVYYMHLSEFMDILLNRGEFGTVHMNNKYFGISLNGWFTFSKRGTSFGIVYLGRSKPKDGRKA
jgi:hypothetical protein